MVWEQEEFLVRYTRLIGDQTPVPIYATDDLEPIRPEWLAITYARIWNARRPQGSGGYVLYFLKDDGTALEELQYDTLDIAIDQAKAIVGVPREQWTECRLRSPRSDGSFRWSDVEGAGNL